MLKIFKNIFFFKVGKTNTKKKKLEKPKKRKNCLLIPENIDDRTLSVCRTVKYQLNIEKKCVSRIKYFKRINFLN